MLLFENLQMNKEAFDQLIFEDIIFLSNTYTSNNIKYLIKYIESEYIK